MKGGGRPHDNVLYASINAPELTRMERAALLIMIDGGNFSDVEDRFGAGSQALVQSALRKIGVKGRNYNEAEKALIEYQKTRTKWSDVGGTRVRIPKT